MEKKQRLVGIDLFRGIAAYAVVILHSDEGITVQSATWSAILHFSAFAVSFFLATSFYLTINKLSSGNKAYNWQSRLDRLLIPYGIWSLIYLVHKAIRYLIKHEHNKIKELFQDPLALIFLGQSAFHLYFIPLLLSGSVLFIGAKYLIRKQVKLGILLRALIGSIIIAELYKAFLSGSISNQANTDLAAQALLELTSLI